MAITISGSGSITGVSAGGLPDGVITAADIASGVLPSAVSDLTNDTGFITSASAGKILQVVSAVDTDSNSQSISVRTWTTVPTISATITPSSTSSKIMMIARLGFEWDAGDIWNLNFAPARNGTKFNISTAGFSGNANNSWCQAMGSVATNLYTDTNTTADWLTLQTVDSPNSTSALTYTIQLNNSNNAGPIYYNRTVDTTNQNSTGMSTEIILMEIAG